MDRYLVNVDELRSREITEGIKMKVSYGEK